MPARARQGGFSLLEAIVAMVIMATGLLTLYSWLSSSTLALNRARAQAQTVDDTRSALALLANVNPMQDPSGEIVAPPLTVRWQSRALVPRRPDVSPAGFPGQFDLSLHELEVEVVREGAPPRSFSVRKAGWELVRPLGPGDE